MVTPRTSLGSMSLVNCRRWKLHAAARASACAEGGLADAGNILDQQMPARQQAHQRQPDGFALRRESPSRAPSRVRQLGKYLLRESSRRGKQRFPLVHADFMILKNGGPDSGPRLESRPPGPGSDPPGALPQMSEVVRVYSVMCELKIDR